jgi:hypothetical protein
VLPHVLSKVVVDWSGLSAGCADALAPAAYICKCTTSFLCTSLAFVVLCFEHECNMYPVLCACSILCIVHVFDMHPVIMFSSKHLLCLCTIQANILRKQLTESGIPYKVLGDRSLWEKLEVGYI